jgi:hypothetical protein
MDVAPFSSRSVQGKPMTRWPCEIEHCQHARLVFDRLLSPRRHVNLQKIAEWQRHSGER